VQLPDKVNDKVTVQPSSVQVNVTVVTSGPIKHLTVVAPLQGNPAEGYTVKTQQVEPSRLQVTGSAGLLSSISELRTKPVDISGAKGNISREVEVILPEGVIPLAQRTVKVTVVIEPLPAEEEEPPDQNNNEQLPG
jgi:YbbR domain-containing protein